MKEIGLTFGKHEGTVGEQIVNSKLRNIVRHDSLTITEIPG